MQQPWPLTQRVLDYRAAKRAVDLMNDTKNEGAAEELAQSPGLQRILKRMVKAQDLSLGDWLRE